MCLVQERPEGESAFFLFGVGMFCAEVDAGIGLAVLTLKSLFGKYGAGALFLCEDNYNNIYNREYCTKAKNTQCHVCCSLDKFVRPVAYGFADGRNQNSGTYIPCFHSPLERMHEFGNVIKINLMTDAKVEEFRHLFMTQRFRLAENRFGFGVCGKIVRHVCSRAK